MYLIIKSNLLLLTFPNPETVPCRFLNYQNQIFDRKPASLELRILKLVHLYFINTRFPRVLWVTCMSASLNADESSSKVRGMSAPELASISK
jgi:hypothetical protein